MVIHDLVLLSHAVPACALVELKVDTNMATHVDLMLAITKSHVIVALVTVVSEFINNQVTCDCRAGYCGE